MGRSGVSLAFATTSTESTKNGLPSVNVQHHMCLLGTQTPGIYGFGPPWRRPYGPILHVLLGILLALRGARLIARLLAELAWRRIMALALAHASNGWETMFGFVQ